MRGNTIVRMLCLLLLAGVLAGCGNGKSDDDWVKFKEVYWDEREDGLVRKPLDPAHVPNLVFTLQRFQIPYRLIGKAVLLVQYRDYKDMEIMWNVTLRSQEKEWLEAAKRNFEIIPPQAIQPGSAVPSGKQTANGKQLK